MWCEERIYWHTVGQNKLKIIFVEFYKRTLWLCCPHWKVECWDFFLLSYVWCGLLWSSRHESVNIILLIQTCACNILESKNMIYQETDICSHGCVKFEAFTKRVWGFLENCCRWFVMSGVRYDSSIILRIWYSNRTTEIKALTLSNILFWMLWSC
jgi:hypothetical protein